jgi:hypothetical protein
MTFFSFSCLLAGILLSGCTPTATLNGLVPCQGTVTLDETPVENATVLFAPVVSDPSRRAAVGKTNAQGQFTLTTLNPNDGVAPGEFIVLVTKYEKFGPIPKKVVDNDGIDITPPQDERNILPKRYENKNTTDLKVVISNSGDKNILIQMKK